MSQTETPQDIRKRKMRTGEYVPPPPKVAIPAPAPAPAAPAMPKLGDWMGMDTLANKGMLTPVTVSNQQIANDMYSSPWYKMAMDKQSAGQNLLLNQANQNAASGLANARSGLAMKGGLRGGSAERLAGMSGNDLAMQRQNVLGQGAVERGNLGMQSAGMASDLAKYNTGVQNTANQFNTQNMLQDLLQRNNQNRFRYGEEMKGYGANRSADAMASAGNSGGGILSNIFSGIF